MGSNTWAKSQQRHQDFHVSAGTVSIRIAIISRIPNTFQTRLYRMLPIIVEILIVDLATDLGVTRQMAIWGGSSVGYHFVMNNVS